MSYVLNCEIVSHDQPAPGHFRMGALAGPIARDARPGQFAMLQTCVGFAPFLRRPMSFEQIRGEKVTFLYRVEGEGTRALSTMRVGQSLSIQGPLGNGFPIDRTVRRHVIVAGGIGVAPFPVLAETLTRACRKPPEVIIGAATKRHLLCGDIFRDMACDVHLATDDGSVGVHGLASEVLETLTPGPDTRLYACGPMPMMRAVARVAAAAGSECYVSLEAQMACGAGACLGCVVESRLENEGERMVRVCVDGPVFDARVIDWETHDFDYDR